MEPEKRISILEKLSRIILATLKEMSKSGDPVNAKALSWNLEEKEEVKKIFDAVVRNGEEKHAIEQDSIVGNQQAQIEALEKERKKIDKMLYDAEEQNKKELDYHERFARTLLSLSHTEENKPYFTLLEKYRGLLKENADLEQREKVLGNIKNLILKQGIETDSDSDTPKKSSILDSIFNNGSNQSKNDKLEKLKRACLNALSELEEILGSDYHATILEIHDRIEHSDDIECVISERKCVIDLIRNFIKDVQSEKEEVTGFLKNIGEKLSSMEHDLVSSSENSSKNYEDDYSFNENLEKEIKSVSDSFDTIDSLEDLKYFVVSKLDHVTHTLKEKREEYIIRIEEAKKEQEKLRKNFENVIGEIQEQNRILDQQSSLDPLTGIYNRRIFEDRIDEELDRFHRYKKPFSLIFFDIDHFKKINDSCGHEAGDKVLMAIAKQITGMVRKPDVFARYGGEEFVIVLPETDIKHGVGVATKLREGIETTVFEYDDKKVPVTISIGITEATKDDRQFQSIVNRADSLMYTAKKRGRNKVVSDLDSGGN